MMLTIFHVLICHLYLFCYVFCSFYNSFLLSFEDSSYTLDIRPLLDMLFSHIFSLPIGCIFILLAVFHNGKCFTIDEIQLTYFSILRIVLLMSYLRTLRLTLGPKDFLLFFLTVFLKGYFPPLSCFFTFVKNQLVIIVLICFWVLHALIDLCVHLFCGQ